MALSAVAGEMAGAGESGRADTLTALMPELDRQFDLLRERMRSSPRG